MSKIKKELKRFLVAGLSAVVNFIGQKLWVFKQIEI